MKTFLLACVLGVLLGESAFERAVLYLSGASEIEELSEVELDRYESLLRHPLSINLCRRSDLEQVLSPWQAASIVEYRAQSGDILSWTELAAVDGFNAEVVEVLRPFLSLESYSSIGVSSRADSTRRSLDVVARSSLKLTEGVSPRYNYALKCRYSHERRMMASLTVKRLYTDKGIKPDAIGWSTVLYGRKALDRVIVGDFNARFGQGLTLWSGMSISSLSSVGSLSRRPTGISPAWTLSPDSALRGVAADWELGRYTLSTLATFDGMVGVNVQRLSPRSSIGATGYLTIPASTEGRQGRVSLDGRVTVFKHLDLYGEVAFDMASCQVAWIGGALWTPQYRHKYALMLRGYPYGLKGAYSGPPRGGSRATDEVGAALSAAVTVSNETTLETTLDAMLHPHTGSSQYRSVSSASVPICGGIVSIKPRLTVRYRPEDEHPGRVECRLDADMQGSEWSARVRGHIVRCFGWSQLYYVEGGYTHGHFAVSSRATAFAVDRWEDRIYCYERDAPGMFSVPAYYGRGVAVSSLASLRFGHHRVYLRAAYTHYSSGPLKDQKGVPTRTDKPSQLELRLQYMLDL